MTSRQRSVACPAGHHAAMAAGAAVITGCPASGWRPCGAGAAGDADLFPDVVRRLLAAAGTELDSHVSDGGWCRACRERFPCERACLAEQILGWF
jgi:hypothetical protein